MIGSKQNGLFFLFISFRCIKQCIFSFKDLHTHLMEEDTPTPNKHMQICSAWRHWGTTLYDVIGHTQHDLIGENLSMMSSGGLFSMTSSGECKPKQQHDTTAHLSEGLHPRTRTPQSAGRTWSPGNSHPSMAGVQNGAATLIVWQFLAKLSVIYHTISNHPDTKSYIRVQRHAVYTAIIYLF